MGNGCGRHFHEIWVLPRKAVMTCDGCDQLSEDALLAARPRARPRRIVGVDDLDHLLLLKALRELRRVGPHNGQEQAVEGLGVQCAEDGAADGDALLGALLLAIGALQRCSWPLVLPPPRAAFCLLPTGPSAGPLALLTAGSWDHGPHLKKTAHRVPFM